MFFIKNKCKNHCNLERLQELNKEVKVLKERLNEINQKGYPRYPAGRDRLKCSSQYFDFVSSLLFRCIYIGAPLDDFVSQFEHYYRELTQDDNQNILKDIGDYFLKCANYKDETKEIKTLINNKNKEIEELKNKLGID
jgi:uncharacterized coiled-coil DUF342 family protein